MRILIDSGILLRMLERHDPQHSIIREAIRRLRNSGNTLVLCPQIVAEFWNVCTRPASARGGFGLTAAEADRRTRLAERLFPVMPDVVAAYTIWRQLIVDHAVMGVQVHDARLVAWMQAQA